MDELKLAKILLVEDNRDHAFLLKGAMKRSELDNVLDVASSGDECMGKLSQSGYDVIILDYNLPKINGLQLMAKIKQADFDIPVIIVTGQGDEKVAVEAMKMGAYDYIVKDGDYYKHLPKAVDQVLKRRILEDKLEVSNNEIIERNRALASLNAIAEIVSRSLDLEEILNDALSKVLEILGLKMGGILLGSKASQELDIKVHKGVSEDVIREYSKRKIKVSESPLGQVVRSGKTVIFDNVMDDSRFRAITKDKRFKTVVGVPLKAQDISLGVLCIISNKHRSFTSEELTLLEAIGNQIGVAVENARLYNESINRAEHIAAINEISNVINSSLDIDKVLHKIASEVRRLLTFDRASIALLNDNEETLEIFALKEKGGDHLRRGHVLPKDGSSVGWTVAHGKYRINQDTEEDCQFLEDKLLVDDGIRSYINVPLCCGEKIIGTFNIGCKMPNIYHNKDAEIVQQIANQIGAAVENARLYQKLKRSKEGYRNLFENAGDSIITVDRDEVIVSWNNAAEDLYGFKRDEVVGKKIDIIMPVNKEDEGKELIKRVFNGEVIKNFETERTNKDGTIRYISLTGSPVRDHDGNIIAACAIVKDLTDRKKLEERLIQSEKLSAIGKLVSGVAHELNNPLTGVMGYAQLLITDPDCDDRIKGDLEKINREAKRCHKIVQNLLSFARKHKPEKRNVDVNRIIENTLEMQDYNLHLNNITIVKELERNLPITMVDEYQLQQVLLNIIINAQQAMSDCDGKGKLIVRTEYVRERRAKPRKPKSNRMATDKHASTNVPSFIRISISDTGPGVAEENTKKIFDPFFTTKEVGCGTGMGLSVCYGIVKEHGGEIYVRSKAERGSIFVVELPVTGSGVIQKDRPETNESDNRAMKGKDILVVDDEAMVLSFIRDVLKMKGCNVDTVLNGGEAISMIEKKMYDAIISDVRMPGIDGRKLYKYVEDKAPALSKRVIFSTGDTVSSETNAFLESIGDRFIRKPFEIRELCRVIETVLAK